MNIKQLYRNYIPLNFTYKNSLRRIIISFIKKENTTHLYFNIKFLCIDKFTPEKWKRQASIISKISDLARTMKPVEPYIADSNRGTWIHRSLFDEFGDWLGKINQKQNEDDTLLGFGTYVKNNIDTIYSNYKINSDPHFYIGNGFHIRSNKENSFICLTDMIDVHDRDIRTWVKTEKYRKYKDKNPLHYLSGNSIFDELNMRITYGHPNLALILLDWLYKEEDRDEDYNGIKNFILSHLSDEERIVEEKKDPIEEFSKLSVKNMKAMCKDASTSNYSKLSREELITLYTEHHNKENGIQEVKTQSSEENEDISDEEEFEEKFPPVKKEPEIIENIVAEKFPLVERETEIIEDIFAEKVEMYRDMKLTSINPVDKLNIANLCLEDFKESRKTPDNKISIYDAIVEFKKLSGKKCEPNTAIKIFERLENDRMTNCHSMDLYKFPKSNGRKGQAIPVCTFSELLPILSQLPGEEAKILRKEQAEITTRAIAGDRDLRKFVEKREITVSPETNQLLMTGLEQRPYTIEDVYALYDTVKNDPQYMISVDLSQYFYKDTLYIGMFMPSREYLTENINNVELQGRIMLKFGVSSEVISRSGNHINNEVFTGYTVLKVFEYHNSFGKSSGEDRLKMILTNMNLRLNYYNKKEVFVATLDELKIVLENMSKHNEMMNNAFIKPFKEEVEIEKLKLENNKQIELEKIKSNREIELEKIKIQTFTSMFERGTITFEQLKEITRQTL